MIRNTIEFVTRPSQAILQEIRRHGLAALDEGFRGKGGLDLPLAEEIAAAMRRKLHEAHCGLLPPSAMGFLVAAQRARDAVLADNLARALELEGGDGAILIAGTSHVRSDRGVPTYLSRLAPGRRVVSIAFVDVEDDALTPEAYADQFDRTLPFDFVWFTRPANPGKRRLPLEPCGDEG